MQYRPLSTLANALSAARTLDVITHVGLRAHVQVSAHATTTHVRAHMQVSARANERVFSNVVLVCSIALLRDKNRIWRKRTSPGAYKLTHVAVALF